MLSGIITLCDSEQKSVQTASKPLNIIQERGQQRLPELITAIKRALQTPA
jgi:hypothetical protein